MTRDAKTAMVRIAVVDGAAAADLQGRRPGRGAYLHRNNECIDRFVVSKVKQFRSLRERIEHRDRVTIAQTLREKFRAE